MKTRSSVIAFFIGLVLLLTLLIVGTIKVIQRNSIPEVVPTPPVTIYVDEKKPGYDYLKSVTTYMFHPILEEEVIGPELPNSVVYTYVRRVHGAVGTGVVVAQRGNEFYILTNKHICEKDVENCFTVLNGNPREDDIIKLTYVKSAKEDVDLELWKVDVAALPGKRAVSGAKSAIVQDRVYSVGNYLGMRYIYTEGTKAGHEDGGDIFNLPCAFGCSGSGIFNDEGFLVALLYAGNGVPTSVDFVSSFDTAKVVAVSYLDIKEFLGDLIND